MDAIHPLTRAEWRLWLDENHACSDGVWLISYKKATGKPRVEYEEAVEEALCFGWIDSKIRSLDAERSQLWFAPRRAKSAWSASNRARVARLIAEGKMHPAGLAAVRLAQENGLWEKPSPGKP